MVRFLRLEAASGGQCFAHPLPRPLFRTLTSHPGSNPHPRAARPTPAPSYTIRGAKQNPNYWAMHLDHF
jgi:hypothetical protein